MPTQNISTTMKFTLEMPDSPEAIRREAERKAKEAYIPLEDGGAQSLQGKALLEIYQLHNDLLGNWAKREKKIYSGNIW